ncbi:hypothetical protein ACI8AK_05010 [Geodermatophilus sp. SYSU D00867]
MVFVVPPRRVAILMDELIGLYPLTPGGTTGPWWIARTADGMTVAVISWEDLLTRIAGVADQAVAEDTRQLLGLVRKVDDHSFVPWTIEQRTDQDLPRRILTLASVVDTVHRRLLTCGAATTTGRRQTITRGGPLAYGKRMRLGNAVVTLRVSLELWARHGRSPLWLTFSRSTAAAAHRAFPGQVIEADGWIAVPVELPVSTFQAGVVDHLQRWLTDAGQRLAAALAGQVPPDDGDFDDGDSDGDSDGDLEPGGSEEGPDV